MITRVKLLLEQDEFMALYQVAKKELRNPADQARHILREELARRGLLRPDRAHQAEPGAVTVGEAA